MDECLKGDKKLALVRSGFLKKEKKTKPDFESQQRCNRDKNSHMLRIIYYISNLLFQVTFTFFPGAICIYRR